MATPSPKSDEGPLELGRLSELLLYRFLISEQLLDAGSRFHAFEMRRAVREFGQIEIKLGAATETPKEMRVRSGEMVEKVFAAREHVVGNLVAFEQWALRQPSDAAVSIGQIANPRRRIDAGQIRVDAGRAPGHYGDGLQLPPRILGQQFRLRKVARDPNLDGDVLAERPPIHHEQRHFVLWIELAIIC